VFIIVLASIHHEHPIPLYALPSSSLTPLSLTLSHCHA